MSRNKYLLIAFGLLLLFFAWKQFIASSDSRNFKKVFIDLDTTAVTKVRIITKINEFTPIDFTKTNNVWEVSNGTISDQANQDIVQGMLSAMVNMKPERLVAKTKDKWNQYEVSDSIGAKVQVFNKTTLIADMVVGKFNFEQSTRAVSTFIRQSEEEETYAVPGMLSSTFNQNFDNFRDRTFIKINTADITSLQFDYQEDSSYVLNKIEGEWSLNSQEVDSTIVQQYLDEIGSLTQRNFVDDFSKQGNIAMYHLAIGGNNMSTIDIDVYKNGQELVLYSSLNENTYFKSEAVDVFNKLLVPSDKFLKKKE